MRENRLFKGRYIYADIEYNICKRYSKSPVSKRESFYILPNYRLQIGHIPYFLLLILDMVIISPSCQNVKSF